MLKGYSRKTLIGRLLIFTKSIYVVAQRAMFIYYCPFSGCQRVGGYLPSASGLDRRIPAAKQQHGGFRNRPQYAR
jgi:hypothetical protein